MWRVGAVIRTDSLICKQTNSPGEYEGVGGAWVRVAGSEGGGVEEGAHSSLKMQCTDLTIWVGSGPLPRGEEMMSKEDGDT